MNILQINIFTRNWQQLFQIEKTKMILRQTKIGKHGYHKITTRQKIVRFCYFSELVLIYFFLKKSRFTLFQPETTVISVFHLMVLVIDQFTLHSWHCFSFYDVSASLKASWHFTYPVLRELTCPFIINFASFIFTLVFHEHLVKFSLIFFRIVFMNIY